MKKLPISGAGARYLIVGGSVYVLELAIITLLTHAGWSAVKAVAAAFIIGTLVSFGLQKLVTFGDKRLHHTVVGLQLLAVSLLVAWNFGFSVLATAVLQHHLPAVVIRTGALGVTTIWNFYLYKTHIFKPTPRDEDVELYS